MAENTDPSSAMGVGPGQPADQSTQLGDGQEEFNWFGGPSDMQADQDSGSSANLQDVESEAIWEL